MPSLPDTPPPRTDQKHPAHEEPALSKSKPPSPDAVGKPPMGPGDGAAASTTGATNAPDLALPHERDAATGHVAAEPDAAIRQAKQDLDRGLVDTDMWGTPGLDNERREHLVPDSKGDALKTGNEPRS